MNESAKQSSQLVATWASFAALCIGTGAVLIQMGRKDQQLATTTEQVKELSNIVSELAKAQVGMTIKDAQVDNQLRELAARLERLERNRS
jgi:hypothetical protein